MLIVPDLRVDTHGDLMSVIEAAAAEMAATNAAVAAAATAATAEAAAASKAAAAHDRRQNRYRGERAARPRRAQRTLAKCYQGVTLGSSPWYWSAARMCLKAPLTANQSALELGRMVSALAQVSPERLDPQQG